ncbi:basic leucine zipper transcriptional factor ATF-like 2 [Tenrec ecaudatus]|uniref:basic leucine zipper transcriptional factor ATF-like 2 n=1 Tax=Tenrec ecaudatus TaxID=94439 RepID=UPI003F5A0BBD
MHLCGSNGLLASTDPKEEHWQRQLKKKQKNRVAAQRSRQRHTDKADTLHQQHESLEKHNLALRKEIQALQAELAWWGRTLNVHQRLCPAAASFLMAPGPPGPPECGEKPSLFQAPASPLLQPPGPPRVPSDPLGLLECPLPSLDLGLAAEVPGPPVQLSPSSVLPPATACPSLQGPSLALRARPAGSPNPDCPPEPLGRSPLLERSCYPPPTGPWHPWVCKAADQRARLSTCLPHS